MYSPSSGNISHVNTNVSQYVILQDTSRTLSGSHMPFDASSSDLALDARSMGTRRTMLAGRARDRKIGTRRYAGAVRSGRKWRRSRRTTREMTRRAVMANTSEAAEDAIGQESGSGRLLQCNYGMILRVQHKASHATSRAS